MVKNFDRAAYQRDGYLIIDELLDPELLARAKAEIDALFHDFPRNTRAALTLYSDGGLDAGQARIDHPHLVSPAIHEILNTKALGNAASQLTGVHNLQAWYCHALRKPKNLARSNHVGWHQDGQYSHFLTGVFVTAWIPLIDITENSSPLIYIRGSHKIGLVKGSGFSHKATLDELKQSILNDHEVNWEEDLSVGKTGFVSFHNSHLIHGSEGNTGSVPRFSIACHMRSENNELLPEYDYKNAVSQIRDTELSPVILGNANAFNFGEM